MKSSIRHPASSAPSYFLIFSFALFALNFTLTSYAQELTIFYTGDTHAMLYPCSCPFEPDGGVARRLALLKKLKKDYPGAVVLDSGSFFSGGLKDEYTQGSELDRRRSLVNLKAMELMKYDAVAIGEDEFNFGGEFLQENINKTNLTFLSSNVQGNKVLPYIIKEVAGVKLGILGVTNPQAAGRAGGFRFSDPKIAVAETVSVLRKNGVNIIVLLSHLGGSADLDLINSIKGIDILIGGRGMGKEEPFSKLAGTLVLRPSWQGRRLGKASFNVEGDKVTEYKVEGIRLSDKISDDPDIFSVLPRCFSDNNCKKEGFSAACRNPGTPDSNCLFTEANKIRLLIITPRECRICNTTSIINSLKRDFPGLVVSYLYYPDKKADGLLRDFAARGLPVYLLGREAEKENKFSGIKDKLDLKGDFYMLKHEAVGFAYFLGRPGQKGKIDLFISLSEAKTPELLNALRDFKPRLHFLAVDSDRGFEAAGGNLEVEEYLRAVCVQKYYPEIFWDYISCRSAKKNSSWWEDCLGNSGPDKVRVCAKGSEGSFLLRENISLNKELKVMLGPAYLLNNQEIFATQGVPKKEDFEKIFKQ